MDELNILNNLNKLRRLISDIESSNVGSKNDLHFEARENVKQLLEGNVFIIRGALSSLESSNKRVLKNSEIEDVKHTLSFVSKICSDINNLNAKSPLYMAAVRNNLTKMDELLEQIKPIVRFFVTTGSGLNDSSAMVERVKNTLKDASILHHTMTVKLAKLDEKIDSASKIIGASSAKFEKISKNLDNLEESNSKYQKTISLLDLESDLISERKSELTAAYELLSSVKKTYSENNETLKAIGDNLSSLESSVSDIESRATNAKNDLDSKTSEIDSIIAQAAAALETTTTVSVGTFFKEQYDISKNRMFIWPSFALAFLIGAIWICYDTLSDIRHGVVDGGAELPYIIARFCIAPLFLLGVWFCTNQYIKQKNITEDYAYKKVLSLSLIGFKSEIQKTGEANTTGFIKSLLKEILRSPLETLDKKHYKRETKLLKLAHDEMISNMFKKVSPQKTEVDEEKK